MTKYSSTGAGTNLVPSLLHGSKVDRGDNEWLTGAGNAIAQKYSHDAKLLLPVREEARFRFIGWHHQR